MIFVLILIGICPAGEENKNGICTKCPIGYFRKTDTATCKKCSNEFLTKEEGAKNESYCIVRKFFFFFSSSCKTF